MCPYPGNPPRSKSCHALKITPPDQGRATLASAAEAVSSTADTHHLGWAATARRAGRPRPLLVVTDPKLKVT